MPRYENFPKETRIDLPPFHGKNDIDEFFYWEMKVRQIFAIHHMEEERKVSLATLSFQGLAMYWWSALVKKGSKVQPKRKN